MPKIDLRPEQLQFVDKTAQYFQDHAKNSHQQARFLWNAKPRFGKTLTTYALIQRLALKRILIVTQRPVIADSWAQDFFKFFGTESEYIFASSQNNKKLCPGVLSRSEITSSPELLHRPLIFFISLQDLKGKMGDTESFKQKNRWIFDVKSPWDLVVLDEGHEGVKTTKSLAAIEELQCNFVLYLSGTPFRAIADKDFSESQILNYSYLDEQKLRSDMPSLSFRLATMTEFLNCADPACADLGEFFRTTNGKFVHEELVEDWMDRLAAMFKHKKQHQHSFWLMSGVGECKAMQKMICAHPYFKKFQTILAAGNSNYPGHHQQLLVKIREMIDATDSGTIVLSCGQLTTGITIPEWSTVLMLYSSMDLSRMSAAQYLQAVFRAQNPWRDGSFVKTFGQVFDFQPERALLNLQNYAENLCGKPTSKSNLHELMEYISIDYFKNQTWQHLSPTSALALPRAVVAEAIVNGGFVVSNQLFNAEEKLSLVDNDVQEILCNSVLSKRRIPIQTAEYPDFDELYNLAAAELVSETGEDISLIEMTHELYNLRRRVTRKKRHEAAMDIRDRLRTISRSIPLLLYTYHSRGCTFENLIKSIPDEDMIQMTGICRADFLKILQSGGFNITNLDLATNEFYERMSEFGSYYKREKLNTIFSLIPTQKSIVLTPESVVTKMVDKIERSRPELFQSKTTRFLDLSARSGLFLAEITRRLYQNLRPEFSSEQECLKHIQEKQLSAFVTDEISAKIVRRTLPKLKDLQLLDPKNMEIKNIWRKSMKFDVIIGNPPYQQGRRQIYADFYRLAVDLDPEILCMIFPIGWQKIYNHNGLGQLNNATYKRDPHLVSIDNYYENGLQKMFPDLGTGGVNIVLRNRQYRGNGEVIKMEFGKPVGKMLLPLCAEEIIKPAELTRLIPLFEFQPKISSIGLPRKSYGLAADVLRHPDKYDFSLTERPTQARSVRVLGLIPDGQRGSRYLERRELPKISPLIDCYKIFVPKAWGNMSERIGLGGSYANICVGKPGDACTETFIEFGPFRDQNEATKMAKYFMTKFFRALLFLAKDTQNTTRDKYRYIPVPNLHDSIFMSTISELDNLIMEAYNIPETSQKYILENTQPRDESNIEFLS